MTTVERSSVGAAGLSFVRPTVIPPTVATPMMAKTAVRILLLILVFAGRLISISLANHDLLQFGIGSRVWVVSKTRAIKLLQNSEWASPRNCSSRTYCFQAGMVLPLKQD